MASRVALLLKGTEGDAKGEIEDVFAKRFR